MAVSSEELAKSLNLLPPEENSVENNEVQKDFRARLKTFIEGQKWVRRPLMLAPSVCAQYGWKCVSSQLLECDTCTAKLSAGQPKVQSYQAYKACMEHIRDCLKSAHKKHCPWPLTPCPVSYVQMIPMHKEEALKEFKKRLESLLTLESNLPQIKDGTLQKLGLTEETCSLLCKLAHVEHTNLNLSGIMLAASGWRREFEAKQKKSLSCYSCQRTVALLFYTTVFCTPPCKSYDINEEQIIISSRNFSEQSNSPNKLESGPSKRIKGEKEQDENVFQCNIHSEMPKASEDTEPMTKRAKISKETLVDFDPFSEHRPWCPWVIESGVRESNSTSDDLCTPSSIWMPGWKLFMKCLLRNTGCSESVTNLMTSPLKEQLNNARNMLESWSSPT